MWYAHGMKGHFGNIGSIVPLTDRDLVSLAKKAHIENATGWNRIKALVTTRIRTLDLTEIEVIEAISEYLIRRPVTESNRIEQTIQSDIRQTRTLLEELDVIALKISPEPTEEQVEKVLELILETVEQKQNYLLTLKNGSKNQDSTKLKKSYQLKEYEYSAIYDTTKKYHYYDNSLYEIKRWYHNDDNHYSTVEDSIFNYVKYQTWKQFEYKVEADTDIQVLTKEITDFISNQYIKAHNELTSVDNNDSQHPIVKELYAKHKSEVIVTRKRLSQLLVDLESQLEKTKEIIAPINAMSKDLRTYLSVAEDVQSIRKATAFLGALEERNTERGHAMAMLAQYSEMATTALGEVKNTLDSYQSAQQEIGHTIIHELEARDAAKAELG